jgi:hypothetical protein
MSPILPVADDWGKPSPVTRPERITGTLGAPIANPEIPQMTYPPTPGGWQDPTKPAEPVVPQPTYVDPISGLPASVSPDPGQSYPAATSPPGYPAAYPTYGATDPTYGTGYPAQQGYPQGYEQPGYAAQPGYPSYPTSYPGYGGYTTPVMPIGQKTNGLSIASLVVSLSGAVFLLCYGLGGLLGLVGAILGHVAQRQIRERGEAGGGMALAGVIVGWIALAIGVVIVVLIAWFAYRVAQDQQTAY